MKQRVIIAYDGSPDGKQALSLGNLLCRTFDAKPVIAYRGGERVAEMDQGYFKNMGNKSPARGLRMLTDQVRPIAVVVGSPAGGTSDRGTSSTENKRILAGTKCPVAVAPPASQALRGFSKICVAVNGTDASDRALDQAASMAHSLGVTLRIVSVLGSTHGSGKVPRSKLGKGRIDRATAILEDAARRVPPGVNIELEGLVGDPAEQLGRYSDGLDLMVVGSRGYGRFGRKLGRSVSSYLMEHARCPVLVTPESTTKRRSAAFA
ncbi:MAG: universal stress protein [Solirubrobacterales bacterium]